MESGCAIVTGGASGIGRATAGRLASDGFRVRILDIDVDGAEETVASIRDSGGEAAANKVDLADLASIDRVLDDIIEEEGTVAVLVNNAGFMAAATTPDTSPDVWHKLVAVNLTAPFYLCRKIIPIMIEAGGGVIVNVASAGALVGIRDRAAYCATKAGLLGLTRSIAADHARQGVRSNAICPGTTETEWIGRLLASDPNAEETYRQMSERQLVGRMGRPEEIASGIAFLCSPDASFMNGSTLVVDGGMTAV